MYLNTELLEYALTRAEGTRLAVCEAQVLMCFSSTIYAAT